MLSGGDDDDGTADAEASRLRRLANDLARVDADAEALGVGGGTAPGGMDGIGMDGGGGGGGMPGPDDVVQEFDAPLLGDMRTYGMRDGYGGREDAMAPRVPSWPPSGDGCGDSDIVAAGHGTGVDTHGDAGAMQRMPLLCFWCHVDVNMKNPQTRKTMQALERLMNKDGDIGVVMRDVLAFYNSRIRSKLKFVSGTPNAENYRKWGPRFLDWDPAMLYRCITGERRRRDGTARQDIDFLGQLLWEARRTLVTRSVGRDGRERRRLNLPVAKLALTALKMRSDIQQRAEAMRERSGGAGGGGTGSGGASGR
jgi:hypothetical protein